MADCGLLNKVHNLSDLELAALLCLIGREHCLLSTTLDAVEDLVDELQLISSRTFGLRCAIINCTPNTTLEDFATSLLLPTSSPSPRSRSISPYQTRYRQPPTARRSNGYQYDDSCFSPQMTVGAGAGVGLPTFSSVGRRSTRPPVGAISTASPVPGPAATAISALSSGSPLSFIPSSSAAGAAGAPSMANIILAVHLDRAPKAVQIQALELLRTRRIFTRTARQAAPRQFLFAAVVAAESGGQAHTTEHLNDSFYLAHWHDPEDGFANLEEGEEEGGRGDNDDGDRRDKEQQWPGLVRRGEPAAKSFSSAWPRHPVFSEIDIASLAKLSREVRVDIDVVRYQMNVISFLRMHRAVAGGISSTATKHFEQLMKSLAPLHGLDYVTPALVGLAARKVYLHRIRIVSPEKERSIQWGSELEAIEALLEGVGPEEVLDDVFEMLPAPL